MTRATTRTGRDHIIRVSIVATIALVAACSSVSPAMFRQTERRLEAGRLEASLSCATRSECDDRWERTRAFIDNHSATPVSVVSDSVIETDEPLRSGVAYFLAERTVNANGATIIRLRGMCGGMYGTDGGPGWMYRECAARVYDVELEFRRSVGSPR